jgi:hypothetical protein
MRIYQEEKRPCRELVRKWVKIFVKIWQKTGERKAEAGTIAA